jgi:peptidyl-prolyl cis-trans isomerase D
MASQTPKAPEKNEPKKSAKGANNPFIKVGGIVVLVIVVIAFIFVPMGGGSGSAISGNGRSLDFGKYDGKAIQYAQGSYMATQVRSLNDQLQQQGLNEQNYQLFTYQVYRGAFERTAIRLAALGEVTKAGASVTEPWLDKKVAESSTFQENGKFSAQKYHDSTLAEKLSVRSQIRDDTLYQAYFSDLLGVQPSSKEIDFVKDMAKDTRTVQYAAFPLSKFPDSEVETWGKAHADLFRSLSLSSVTIQTSEADAKKLLKNIQDKKATFADVAKASSKDSFAAKGGLQGAKYFYELSSELSVKADADKLAALKVGELSPVLKTSSGTWVFFKAEAAPIPADFSQGVVVSAVRDYITGRERGVIEDWCIAQAKSIFASGSGFEAAVKKAGSTIKSAGPFPLNYGDLKVSLYGQSAPMLKAVSTDATPELALASTSEKFLTQAFSLAPGSISEPFVLGDNVIVLKVKEAAAAKDDETGAIGFYYPYFFQSGASTEVRDLVMKSKLLKDDFSTVFFKYFQPATKTTANKG